MPINSDLKEVFRTQAGCVYQCDKTCLYWVEYAGYFTSFKIPCFLSLKRLVDKIDLDAMAMNPQRSSDIEIINPCGCERIYALTLKEAFEFKELLQGAKAMLQLNSIIRERLETVCL